MAIEPNTNIKVYHNVPLDINQDRSIAWANIGEQNSYFHTVPSSILKYNFAQSTYQRVRKGAMRIERKADDLYDCNYLAFQNTNYGNKWFYAFITSVEYVNDITSEITFEIDDLQTWYFEMQLQPCIIERTHASSDGIGEHIEPEPVTLGDYVINYILGTQDEHTVVIDGYKPLAAELSEMCVIVAYVDVDGAVADGKLYDGIYGGATLKAFRATDADGINDLLEQYIITPDSIISIYMCPSQLIRDTVSSPIPLGGMLLSDRNVPRSINATVRAIDANNTLIDNYKPRNNKLYTYPYNYLQVDNSNGSLLKIRYEFCRNLKPRFEIRGTLTQPVELILRPDNYKNCDNGMPYDSTLTNQPTLKTETLSLNVFPHCSWNTDGFQAWLVNTGIPYGLQTVGGFVDTLLGGATQMPTVNTKGESQYNYPNVIPQGLATGFLSTYYSSQTEGQKDNISGNFSCGNVNCAIGQETFYAGRYSITKEYAKIIDDFFDKYGYTCMRLQTPNLRVRPHWTYVKTRDCSLNGNVPAMSKQNIKNIFNRGITFWKNASEVGNYSLNNSI